MAAPRSCSGSWRPAAFPLTRRCSTGGVLLLETSEELIAAREFGWIVRALGERGLLAPSTPCWWRDHRSPTTPAHPGRGGAPRPAARRGRRRGARYNPDAVIFVGVPFGHTRPQWILPYGGDVTVDGVERRTRRLPIGAVSQVPRARNPVDRRLAMDGTTMEPTQTALIVPIPEAERAVGPVSGIARSGRLVGRASARDLLYPFLSPQQIDEQVLAVLRETVAGIPRFDVALTHVDWFGDTVLWLAPQPARPFRELTSAVWQQFPQAPPYAGAHSDVVPHLTIGHDADKPGVDPRGEDRRRVPADQRGRRQGPLIAGTPDVSPWRTVCEFPLGTHP